MTTERWVNGGVPGWSVWLQCDFTLKPRKPSFSALCLLSGVNSQWTLWRLFPQLYSTPLTPSVQPSCSTRRPRKPSHSMKMNYGPAVSWLLPVMRCAARWGGPTSFSSLFIPVTFLQRRPCSHYSTQQKGEERQEVAVDRKQEQPPYFVGGNCFWQEFTEGSWMKRLFLIVVGSQMYVSPSSALMLLFASATRTTKFQTVQLFTFLDQ